MNEIKSKFNSILTKCSVHVNEFLCVIIILYLFCLIYTQTSAIGINNLVRQLGLPILPLWGDERDKASIVRDVYEAIKNKAPFGS